MQPKRTGLGSAAWVLLIMAAAAADPPLPSVNAVGIKAVIIDTRGPDAAPIRVDGFLRFKDPKHSDDGGPRPKQLAITLTRQCRQDLSDLRVQWRLMATDVESHKQVQVGTGEVPIALTNLTPVCITSTPPVTITYVPAKMERVDNRNANNNATAGRIVRATGQRMSGWAVQVFQGSALVGEKYSDPSLKAMLEGKAPPKSTRTTMGLTDKKTMQ